MKHKTLYSDETVRQAQLVHTRMAAIICLSKFRQSWFVKIVERVKRLENVDRAIEAEAPKCWHYGQLNSFVYRELVQLILSVAHVRIKEYSELE